MAVDSSTLRAAITATARAMNALRINRGKSGNVSARIDGGFLVTPSGLPYADTAAEDIVAVSADGVASGRREPSTEWRFHRDVYAARPEVMAIVHSHSASVIPFGSTKTKLRPIYHMGSFLWSGAPVFDIRKTKPDNDLLIRDRPLGKALAGTLGKCNCVLMRGHGMTVIGDSVPEAVVRAIYTEMNARLQLQATQLEGPIEFLSDEEGRRSQAANRGTIERPWELWKKSAPRSK